MFIFLEQKLSRRANSGVGITAEERRGPLGRVILPACISRLPTSGLAETDRGGQ